MCQLIFRRCRINRDVSLQLNRVKATEKEKSDLEGAKDEAEHYLSLQTEKAKKQQTLYSKYM